MSVYFKDSDGMLIKGNINREAWTGTKRGHKKITEELKPYGLASAVMIVVK